VVCRLALGPADKTLRRYPAHHAEYGGARGAAIPTGLGLPGNDRSFRRYVWAQGKGRCGPEREPGARRVRLCPGALCATWVPVEIHSQVPDVHDTIRRLLDGDTCDKL